jgi:hypothetical protein
MFEYSGHSSNLALFGLDGQGIVVDINLNLIVETGDLEHLSSKRTWSQAAIEFSTSTMELVEKSFNALTPISASGSRMYTIPSGVQAEAKKALEWHKEHHRGGTPVGMNTARTLAKGGQIGIEKLRHVAKYFPRHEVDKKGKGWEPGEDNFPSNGRIAWALWGGDAGWRWAKKIVERENALTADASGPNIDALRAFDEAYELDETYGPEFVARVRLNDGRIDRLYKVDINGAVALWDDNAWDNLGDIDSNIWSLDAALDADSDQQIDYDYFIIDPESAVIIAGRLASDPYSAVSIDTIDADEAELMAQGIISEDIDILDLVLMASANEFANPTSTGSDPNAAPSDGYTPDERSQNVQKQSRNAKGWWIKSNDRVAVGNDQTKGKGTVVGTNPDGTVKVKLDSGNEVNVDGKFLYPEGNTNASRPNATQVSNEPNVIDLSGIIGEPRTPINQPKAHIPGTLPPMDAKQIHTMLTDWTKYVSDMRKSYKPSSAADAAKATSRWGITKFKGNFSIIAAGSDTALTPETTDVPPKYFAIVSPEDPAAVMDLVALIPASATSTAPATFKRQDKKWVEDPQIARDMQSATPPPVVMITNEILDDILKQVDGIKTPIAASLFAQVFLSFLEVDPIEALTAAGGLDRNRGNAEKLRRYWVRGEGAAKIRWGTPGDWKRCVKHLAKYMGPRAKGYCQLRHKDALGYYTATHAKRDRGNFSNDEYIMEEVWAEDTGVPGYIEDKHLLTPVEDIQAEHDDIYDNEWEPDFEIIEAMEEISQCADDEFIALIAAGGLDRNKGNAEELRHYWTRGEGALKIRWGTPGDWTRCVRHLTKYMGVRAKGYCQLRHKEVTGVYTGSKFNPGKNNNKAYFSLFNSEEEMDTAMIAAAALTAKADFARERVLGIVASGNSNGASFKIPLLIPETMESGDGRKFKKDAIEVRDLPLPLLWQIKTGEGHNGSVVVGRIDHMERTEDGIGNAYGVFDTGPYGREAERLVRNGFIRGVSADLDQFEAKEYEPEASEKSDEISKQKLIINHARVMAATIVAKPAFQECTIFIDGESANQEEELIPQDGIYEESVDSFVAAEALTASGFLESEIPVTPPSEWFQKPALTKATPLTIDTNGYIFGHIAAWHVNHIGMPRATRPPRSKSKYAYFHTGVVRTAEGKDVPVGQLTLAGGHASLHASAEQAAKHYDDTASAIADVHAGEDDYGIWVAGSLRPDVTEAQIRALRASAPSGDWRPIGGSLELVAVCQVNVPGFPIARAMVASGKVMALVAAGAYDMAVLKSEAVMSLSLKAQKMSELGAITEAALQRAEAEFGYIPRAKREEYASKGWALPDGSFPIKTKDDIKAAIHAYGRAKDKEAARKHIVKRARALKVADLIPEEWKKPKTVAASAQVESLRERALVASAIAELATISEQERKALAEEGAALPDGSYPIRNEKDLKNAIKAYGRSNPKDRAKVRAHIRKRARALKLAVLVPEEWKSASSMEASSALDEMRAIIASISEFANSADAKGTISEEELKKLADAKAEADKQTADEIKLAEDIKAGKTTAQDAYDKNGRTKYTPVTQPRDARGKYRKVLARLRQDLGVAGLQDALNKVQTAENLEFAGNYVDSAKASGKLLEMIDRLDSKALNPRSLENVRATAKELGTVISNLPLPFGKDADKLRFSDLPAGLKDLIKGMISRVEDKIGKKDADIATASLKSYMSGADVYSQGEVQSEMSTLLRLLT